MHFGGDREQRRLFTFGAVGLGLILSLVWALALVLFPPGLLLTVVDYSFYVVSISIVGLPTFSVLRLYARRLYAAVIAVIVWAVWVFGVKTLFVWAIRALAGR